MRASLSACGALRSHWPEYLIEAWALGMFMVAAGAATTLFEAPGMPLRIAVGDAGLRRALIGVLMGASAVALIYSPWGRRSGAHMNPAVTLAFLSLGRVAPWDALFYAIAQCLGGLLGVLVAAYIALEAPLSGMSMNPARSLASALPSGLWDAFWVYCSAAVLGMWLATRAYLTLGAPRRAGCAKLWHAAALPCIHCGYAP